MPTLGNALDFQKYEARNMRGHQLGAAPSSPVTGQLYYNTGDNTLYWWDGSQWVSARGGASATPPATTIALGTIQLAGDLAGTATSPQIAPGVIVDADVALANKDGTTVTPSMRTLGTGATQAAAGNDSRFSDSRPPSGTAGGDLSGTYPNPQIATGVIVDTDVAAANKDGAAATPSLRTLGAGATQAASGNDARFTDARTPTAHHLTHEPGGSDAMAVNAAAATGSLRTLALTATAAMPGSTTLDVVTAPAADLNLNSKKITSLATPTAANDAANKAYVDAAAQGLDAKASVKVATTVSISGGSAPAGAQTIDGIAIANGDRVLVKDQANAQFNGIWLANTSASWNRAADMDNWLEVPSAYVWVEQGTTQSDTGWLVTSDQGGTIDTTAMTWVQFSGAAQVIAGGGLTKTGNTLDVGAGAGITVNADTIQVANNGITNAMIADGAIDLSSADVTNVLPVGSGGTGSSFTSGARNNLSAAGWYTTATHGAGTSITVTQATHGLRQTRGLIVMTVLEATGAEVIGDVVVSGVGDVTVTFGASQAANSIRVTIVG